MDILALKELLRPVVGNLKDHCTNKIPDLCRQLGLPVPKEEGCKRERLHGAVDLLDDADMPELARTLLARKVFNPSICNNIQDLLSENTIYEMERRGEFPQRFNLTPRCVVWDLDEVEKWIESRKQAMPTTSARTAIKPDVRLRKTRPVRAGSHQK